MDKALSVLKMINRTLLEMQLGIVFICGVFQLVGAFIVKDQGLYAGSIWFGCALSLASSIHMYRSLDRALGSEKTAAKLIFRDYLIRYALIGVILLIIIQTGVLNPLVVFLAYMSLKVTAFIQPITHKLCNKIFHETDPVPQPMPEESDGEDAEEDRGDDAGA